MLNQFKRNPLCFKEGEKNVVIFEFSIGKENSSDSLIDRPADCYISDPNLNQQLEAFIRFAYSSIADDYTTAQNRTFMQAWTVHETVLANIFIEHLLKCDQEKMNTARLFIIFQNNAIRFAAQVIEDEREYVSDVVVEGCTTKAIALEPIRQQGIDEFRSAFTIQLSSSNDRFNKIYADKFYQTKAIEAAQSYMKNIEAGYNTIARMLRQDYCAMLLGGGAPIREVSDIPPVKFSDISSQLEFDKALRDALVDIYHKRNSRTLEEGVSVLSENVSMEVRLIRDVTNKQNPIIKIGIELSSVLITKFPDGQSEREYTAHWNGEVITDLADLANQNKVPTKVLTAS